MSRIPAITKSKLTAQIKPSGSKVFCLTITRRDFEVIVKFLTPAQKEEVLTLGRENGPMSDKLLALHKMIKILEEAS